MTNIEVSSLEIAHQNTGFYDFIFFCKDIYLIKRIWSPLLHIIHCFRTPAHLSSLMSVQVYNLYTVACTLLPGTPCTNFGYIVPVQAKSVWAFTVATADNIENYLLQTAYLITRNKLITCEIETIRHIVYKRLPRNVVPRVKNRIQIKTRKVYMEVNR